MTPQEKDERLTIIEKLLQERPPNKERAIHMTTHPPMISFVRSVTR